MKMSNKLSWFLTFIIAALVTLPALPVAAASASISISMVSEQAIENNNCTLAVSVSANTTLASVNMIISYDSEYLEPVSENSLYELKDSTIMINDPNLKEKLVQERKYILQFKLLKKGKTTIYIDGTPKIYDSSNGEALSISKKEFELSIYGEGKKSDNNKLASFSVKEGTFSTKFTKEKTVYELIVPYENSKITVTAEPEDSGASVAIIDNDKLQVGANKVAVIVTSESGKEREYTIYVTRESLEDGIQTNSPPPSITPEPSDSEIVSGSPVPFPGNTYQIMKEEGLTYYKGNTTYLLLEPYDDTNVPKGYKKIMLKLSDIEVTAYAMDGNNYQDFVLIYAKQEGKDPDWYQFDQKEGTIQRYKRIPFTENEEMKSSNPALDVQKYQDRIDVLGIIMGIEACAVILLLIIVTRMYMKQKGYNDELE